MGEMADYILNGDDCQECGMHIGNGQGFPRSCSACQPRARKVATPLQPPYATKTAKNRAKKLRRKIREQLSVAKAEVVKL